MQAERAPMTSGSGAADSRSDNQLMRADSRDGDHRQLGVDFEPSFLMAARYKSRAWLSCAILFVAAALLIAACGSSSSTRSATASAGQNASDGPAPHTTAQLHHDVVSDGAVTQRPARGTGGNAINDDNPGRADSGGGQATGQSPCALVSRAEAQAIVGRPIDAPVEAPLGPTCIYQPRGGKALITLTVESIDFSKIRAQIRDPTRVEVGGRTAYCGNYGQPVTLVPLAGGRILDVTAPCAIGVRFAAKALPRLNA
jgi:hypothetical protein